MAAKIIALPTAAPTAVFQPGRRGRLPRDVVPPSRIVEERQIREVRQRYEKQRQDAEQAYRKAVDASIGRICGRALGMQDLAGAMLIVRGIDGVEDAWGAGCFAATQKDAILGALARLSWDITRDGKEGEDEQ